jgi:hypothetical protein
MTVRITDGHIVLEGRCPASDAEELLAALCELAGASVDIGGASKMHMAVLQVLLAVRPIVTGCPSTGPLSQVIFRALISGSDINAESF